MEETMSSTNTSTKRQWIAELAGEHPEWVFTTLHRHLDLEWMREAYRQTRKDGAPGIDGATAADYEKDLEANLEGLLGRIKSGRYKAPPVRRHYIPKADGTQRPLGIPTFEDKVAQRAIVMLLEPVYEADFLPCSHGFRPGRSAHDALHAVRAGLHGGMQWVIDMDIAKYFDTIPHGQLRAFLDQRIKDGVIRKMLNKWLKAGVLDEGVLQRPRSGTPQGGVVSPLLANLYLHHVLDEWFEQEVRPRLQGRCQLVRYADDAVMLFENEQDGQRVLAVGQAAWERAEVHPDKTRYLDFRRRSTAGTARSFWASLTAGCGLGTDIWLWTERPGNGSPARASCEVVSTQWAPSETISQRESRACTTDSGAIACDSLVTAIKASGGNGSRAAAAKRG